MKSTSVRECDIFQLTSVAIWKNSHGRTLVLLLLDLDCFVKLDNYLKKKQNNLYSLWQLGCNTLREFFLHPSSMKTTWQLVLFVWRLSACVAFGLRRFLAASKTKLVCDSVCSLSLQNAIQTKLLLLLLFSYYEFISLWSIQFCSERQKSTRH